MVKSKKMSKTSIAVIVLAILLTLSLVLGLTGAWFTDKANTDKSATISFGQIDISADSTAIASGAWTDVLPGDQTATAGTVTAAQGSEAMYVLVTPTATLKDGENALALVTTSGGSTPVLTVTFAPQASDGWTEITSFTGEGDAVVPAGSHLYYVDSKEAAKTLGLSGIVKMNEETKNVAYNGSTPVRLNLSEESYTVKIDIHATAVQARNITASGNTTVTKAELAEILTAIGTFESVEANANA